MVKRAKDSELTPEERKLARFRLTSEEQMQVCRMFARYAKNEEVFEFCKNELGKTINLTAIKYYKESSKWKPIVNKFRDEYTKGIMEVPIANKRVRLEALQDMFEAHKEEGDLKQAQAVLKDAREELDGGAKFGNTNVFMTQVNNYKDMTDEEIEAERLRQLENLQKVRALKGRAEYENGKLPALPEVIDCEDMTKEI